MSDDHAATAIGAYGGRLAPLNPTPAIDRLAREGMLFENVFATNSICTPSRACVITGQYNHVNKAYDLTGRIDPAQQTLAHEMKRAGYQTAMIGKWHLAAEPTVRQQHAIDPARIYAAGHSNGAAFTYLLWQQRAATFAAFAPVAGGMWAARENKDAASLLVPKPVLQIAGRKDPTVKFELMEAMVGIVKRVNGCETTSVPWGDDRCTLFPSKTGQTPVVAYYHPGGHGVPKDAVELIARFFQEHRAP